MILRAAGLRDRAALIQLAVSFVEKTQYRGAPPELVGTDPAVIGALLDNLFSLRDLAAIFVVTDADDVPFGGIALVDIPSPVTTRRYADELAWFVEPTHRGFRAGPRLLAAAEDWARTRGLHMIKMVAPFGTRVGAFYERRGYTPIETSYVKVL